MNSEADKSSLMDLAVGNAAHLALVSIGLPPGGANITLSSLDLNHTSTEVSLPRNSVLVDVLVTLASLIITLCTVVGNLLVVLAVCMERRLRKVGNSFLVSLAVADLLVGLVVTPLALAYHLQGDWSWGASLCDIFLTLDISCCTASILNLCAISVDRYLAITSPLRYALKRTPRRAVMIIVTVWILSVAVAVPPLLVEHGAGLAMGEGDAALGQCVIWQDKVYTIFSTCAAFYIPLAVMLTVYYKIYRETIMRQKQWVAGPGSTSNMVSRAESIHLEGKRSKVSGGEKRECNGERKLRWKERREIRRMMKDDEMWRSHKEKEVKHVQNGLGAGVTAEDQKDRNGNDYTLRSVSENENSNIPSLVTGDVSSEGEVSVGEKMMSRTISEENGDQPEEIPLRGIRAEAKPRAFSKSKSLGEVLMSRWIRKHGGTSVNPRVGSRLAKFSSSMERLNWSRSEGVGESTMSLDGGDEDEDGGEEERGKSKQKLGAVWSDTPSIHFSVCDETTNKSADYHRLRQLHQNNHNNNVKAGLEQHVRREEGNKKDGATTRRYLQLPHMRRDRAQRGHEGIVSIMQYHVSCSAALAKPHVSMAPTNHVLDEKNLITRVLQGGGANGMGHHTPSPARSSSSSASIIGVGLSSVSFGWARGKKRLHRRISMQQEARAARTLGVIMGAFVICWLPFFLNALLAPLCDKCRVPPLLELVFLWLGYGNSALNPIIYTFFNRDFRRAFAKMLRCECATSGGRVLLPRAWTAEGSGLRRKGGVREKADQGTRKGKSDVR